MSWSLGNKIVNAVDLSTLPAKGQLLNPYEGALCYDTHSGDILMYTGDSWCTSRQYKFRKLVETLKKL